MLSARLDTELRRNDLATADGTINAMLALKPEAARDLLGRRKDAKFRMLSERFDTELKRTDFSAADCTIMDMLGLRPEVAAEVRRRRIEAEFCALSARLDGELQQRNFAAADGTTKAIINLDLMGSHAPESDSTHTELRRKLKARLEAKKWAAAKRALNRLRGMKVDDATLGAIDSFVSAHLKAESENRRQLGIRGMLGGRVAGMTGIGLAVLIIVWWLLRIVMQH
jgi:hypothetical protein